jgi:hypothetical protein
MSKFEYTEVSSESVKLQFTTGSIAFGEANTLTILRDGKESEINVTAYADGQKIVLVSNKMEGDYGKHDDFALNYCYLHLIVTAAENSLTMEYGSKYIYGYNHENSYIDLTSNYIISNTAFNKLQADFEKAFGEAFSLYSFLQTMFSSADVDTIKYDIDKLMTLGVLKTNTIEKVSWEKSHNCIIIHHSDKPICVEDLLAQSIMQSYGHMTFFSPLSASDKIDVEKIGNMDIVIIISENSASDYTYLPSDKAVTVVSFGFYSMGCKLLKSLKGLYEKTVAESKVDRKEELENAFKAMTAEMQKGGEGGDGGGCGNCDKEGGCCGGKTKGGCGSGDSEEKVSFLDGAMSIEEFKEQEKKGCCGGKKCATKVEDVKADVKADAKIEKKGCCNPSSEGTCCLNLKSI